MVKFLDPTIGGQRLSDPTDGGYPMKRTFESEDQG